MNVSVVQIELIPSHQKMRPPVSLLSGIRSEVCGKLLIRSILVLLKKYKKTDKRKKKQKKRQKARDDIEGALYVFFFSFVQWCFVITLVSRLASLA
jgi:Trk-type K+ transport system membrane component